MKTLARTLLALSLFAGGAASARSVEPVSPAQLCVDRIVLKTGRTIRGAVLRQEQNGELSVAVSRAWLERRNPELFARLSHDEAATERRAREQLRDRLKLEIPAAGEAPRLTFFLSQQLERVEAQLARADAPEPPQFIWLDLAQDEIASVARAAPERQRLALWAWERGLADVESRAAADLLRELKTRGVDPSNPPPDLSDRVPVRTQDDREWSARMALVGHTLQEPLDFQGTGDLLVRTGGERDVKDMGPLIVKILRGQVEALTNELLNEGRPVAVKPAAQHDWLKPAVPEAERLEARAFRATRVDLQLERRQVEVESAFVVRFENRGWEPIWSARQVEDVKPRAEAEARIAGDPQVKAAVELIKNLGIGGEEQMQQAIRFGAATMAAQQAADAGFYRFRDRYLKQLDSPPLWWAAPPQP
jgi:hypothetical protein